MEIDKTKEQLNDIKAELMAAINKTRDQIREQFNGRLHLADIQLSIMAHSSFGVIDAYIITDVEMIVKGHQLTFTI